jgi:hypothetical protein
VKLTAHLHLALRLRMHGAIPLLPSMLHGVVLRDRDNFTLDLYLMWNSFQCHCHIFFSVFNILKFPPLLGRLHFWKQPEVIQSQIRKIGWVFHFGNQFLVHKLLDRECLVSWSIFMVENSITEPKFSLFYAASHNHFSIST